MGPWGCNYARLVWQFCNLIKWPAETAALVPKDPGISWTELTVSFMLWAGRLLPIRVSDKTSADILEYNDPKTAVQPTKMKSVRVLSETFRPIVKHIQTFSRAKILPAYKLQGASSLTRLGFSRYHESGVSRRSHDALSSRIQRKHTSTCRNLFLPFPITHRSIMRFCLSLFRQTSNHQPGLSGLKLP